MSESGRYFVTYISIKLYSIYCAVNVTKIGFSTTQRFYLPYLFVTGSREK